MLPLCYILMRSSTSKGDAARDEQTEPVKIRALIYRLISEGLTFDSGAVPENLLVGYVTK